MKIEEKADNSTKKRKFVASFGKDIKIEDVKKQIKAKEVAKLNKKNKKHNKEQASFSWQQETSADKVLGFRDFDDITGNDVDIQKMIELSRNLYKVVGVYSDIVETMASLVCSGIIINSTGNEEYDKKYRLFARDFNKNIFYTDTGLKNYIYDMVKECLKSGNTFYQVSGFTNYTSKLQKRTLKAEDGKSTEENITFEEVNIELPNVLNLNPEEIEIPEDYITENTGKIFYSGDEFSDIYQMAFDKSMYNLYGNPFVARIANDIYNYLLLKVMDNSQLEDLIQIITTISIPDDLIEDADNIAETIRTAQKSNLSVALNEGIEIKMIGVRDKYNDLGEKIEKAERQVIHSAGLSEILISGYSANSANSDIINVFLSKIISKIERMHDIIANHLRNIFEKFAENNNIDIIPEISLSKPILKLFLLDKYFMQMYDRGLLSGIDLVEQAGFDVNSIIFSMQEELINDYQKLGFGVKKDLPYYSGGDPSDLTNPDDDENKGDNR